jgi:hypothetical protein
VRAAAMIVLGVSLGALGYRARERAVAVRDNPVLRLVSPSLVATDRSSWISGPSRAATAH